MQAFNVNQAFDCFRLYHETLMNSVNVSLHVSSFQPLVKLVFLDCIIGHCFCTQKPSLAVM